MITIAHSGLPRQKANVGQEVVFERGSGGMVIDADGNEYVDFVLGYGSVVLGHNVTRFRRLLDGYSNNGLLLPGYSSWHITLLRTLLHGKADNFYAAFFKTGSESVTAAIRLASRLSAKRGIIRCGFVGWHDAQLAKSVRWHEPLNSPLRTPLRFTEGFRGVSGEEAVYNWVSLDIDELESIIDVHGHKIGCMILDTYQLRFTKGKILEAAIHLCRKHKIYVVTDETKIAGRICRLGFATEFAWDADFIIIGKALANGAPLSILLGRPELMAASEESRITGTFSQELSAVFSALATLKEMKRLDGYALLRRIGTKVVDSFNVAARETGLETFVQAESLFDGQMFDLHFSTKILGDWDCRQNLRSSLADHGVLLLQGHPSYICLEHRKLDFDLIQRRFQRGLANWKLRHSSLGEQAPPIRRNRLSSRF